MITLDEARAAKAILRTRIGRPSWLRGVGIGHDGAGNHVVKVNVATVTEEVRAQLPTNVGHVPVVVEAVGDIVSRGRP